MDISKYCIRFRPCTMQIGATTGGGRSDIVYKVKEKLLKGSNFHIYRTNIFFALCGFT